MNASGCVPSERGTFLPAASLLLGLGVALFVSVGCATLKDVPTTHIVMINGDFTEHLKFWKSECWWSPGTDYPSDCYEQ